MTDNLQNELDKAHERIANLEFANDGMQKHIKASEEKIEGMQRSLRILREDKEQLLKEIKEVRSKANADSSFATVQKAGLDSQNAELQKQINLLNSHLRGEQNRLIDILVKLLEKAVSKGD